jgi:hypothetical protein
MSPANAIIPGVNVDAPARLTPPGADTTEVPVMQPHRTNAPQTPEERFWARVVKTDSCWLWRGSLTHGYGIFHIDGEQHRAHRWSYERFVGPIPDGLELDHLCRTKACVNPEHLQPVDGRENTIRGNSFAATNARRTHCPQGHALEGDNVLWVKRAKGVARRCRACYQEEARRQEERVRRRPTRLVPYKTFEVAASCVECDWQDYSDGSELQRNRVSQNARRHTQSTNHPTVLERTQSRAVSLADAAREALHPQPEDT